MNDWQAAAAIRGVLRRVKHVGQWALWTGVGKGGGTPVFMIPDVEHAVFLLAVLCSVCVGHRTDDEL